MKSLTVPAIALFLAFALVGFPPASPAAEAGAGPAKTRKVVLESTGSGYRWKLVEAPVPAPGPRQVLMRVRAVALNRGDLEMLAPSPGADLSGMVVASDAAGEILAVGSDVTEFRPGMRVTTLYFRNWVDGPMNDETLKGAHGASTDGVLAEYLVIDDTAIAPAPAGLGDAEAAALPTAGLTAWAAVNAGGPVAPGDVVLVQGTGGVSTFALQFAAAAGAKVIVTSSSDEKIARARTLGAAEGINYRTTPEWSKRVLELTSGNGADVVVDVGGKATLAQSAQSLAWYGTLSVVGGLSGYDGQIPAVNLLMRRARAEGIYVGSRADFLKMSGFIAQHGLKPVIEREFPLERYEEALALLESGGFVGKIILRP
jgi:NADPH:quinone reductase-like Zn-dependent oxidoreductase